MVVLITIADRTAGYGNLECATTHDTFINSSIAALFFLIDFPQEFHEETSTIEQDSQNGIARTGEPEKYNQNRTARAR
jgi:hypothetical protein